MLVAHQELEQRERLHTEELQWLRFRSLQQLEKTQRQDRLELLLGEINGRGTLQVDEAAAWGALEERHGAVVARAQQALRRALEAEEMEAMWRVQSTEAEARMRRETEERLRLQGRAQREGQRRDWYQDAAAALELQHHQAREAIVKAEVGDLHTVTAAAEARRQQIQMAAEERAKVEAEAKAEAERLFRAAQQRVQAEREAAAAAAIPAAMATALPSPKAAAASEPLSEATNAGTPSRKERPSHEADNGFGPDSPVSVKVLPPLKKNEWETVTDAAGWRLMYQGMPSATLAPTACGRLVDGYLKTRRRPPNVLMRADLLLKAVVIDLADAGLADMHVAPLLILLQRSPVLQCLHLDNNALTDYSADLAADLLMGCRTLYRLSLSWNGIGPAGAQRLLEALKQCPHVSCLDLDGNNISHTHLQKIQALVAPGSIGHALASPSLRGLAQSYPSPQTPPPQPEGPDHWRPAPSSAWESGALSPAAGHKQWRPRGPPAAAAPLPALSHRPLLPAESRPESAPASVF